MPDDFQIYRIFCSTPGALEIERDRFHDLVGEVNENGGVESKVLFAPVICRGAAAAGGLNAAVRQNVRDADFFVQVLGSSWDPPAAAFDELFELALECRADEKLPMREIAVLLKDGNTDRFSPSVTQFRKNIADNGRVLVRRFDDVVSFESQLTVILSAWRQELQSQMRSSAAG